MVKDFPGQEVIKQSDHDNIYCQDIKTIDRALMDFERMIGREAFVSGKSFHQDVHEQRFNKPVGYD